MKTFLNVLFRRVLYKIPLKLLLVLLAITAVFIACFSSADNGYYVNGAIWSNTYLQPGETWASSFSIGDILCFQDRTYSSCNNINITVDGNSFSGNPYMGYNSSTSSNVFCIKDVIGAFILKNNSNSNCSLFVGRFVSDELVPKLSSLECQTEYNLIPINSVDQNYCTSNNLCPTYDCPTNPIGTGSLSNLYINNILHIGAPNIIMNIPEEIDWDYAYTAGGQNMNIDIFGYNVDYDKIDTIVNNQSYVPTQEDFNSLVLVLVPYTKIIIAFLVVLLVWSRVKKPFKSKKL